MTPIPEKKSHKLRALIAEAKANKPSKVKSLKPYAAVLLNERRAGASIRIMVESLARVGVVLSNESLRLWFKRQEVSPALGVRRARLMRALPLESPATPAQRAPDLGPRIARADI